MVNLSIILKDDSLRRVLESNDDESINFMKKLLADNFSEFINFITNKQSIIKDGIKFINLFLNEEPELIYEHLSDIIKSKKLKSVLNNVFNKNKEALINFIPDLLEINSDESMIYEELINNLFNTNPNSFIPHLNKLLNNQAYIELTEKLLNNELLSNNFDLIIKSPYAGKLSMINEYINNHPEKLSENNINDLINNCFQCIKTVYEKRIDLINHKTVFNIIFKAINEQDNLNQILKEIKSRISNQEYFIGSELPYNVIINLLHYNPELFSINNIEEIINHDQFINSTGIIKAEEALINYFNNTGITPSKNIINTAIKKGLNDLLKLFARNNQLKKLFNEELIIKLLLRDNDIVYELIKSGDYNNLFGDEITESLTINELLVKISEEDPNSLKPFIKEIIEKDNDYSVTILKNVFNKTYFTNLRMNELRSWLDLMITKERDYDKALQALTNKDIFYEVLNNHYLNLLREYNKIETMFSIAEHFIKKYRKCSELLQRWEDASSGIW